MIVAENLSCVFGARKEQALALLQAGEDRAAILSRTGTVVALADVSLRVNEGELVVVMGLSGSGKSTLLRCLNRLIEPTGGTITVAGQDVCRMKAAELREFRRRTFGMVFQHFALLPHRTVLANVEFGLEVQGIGRAERRRAAEKALDLVGLAGWESKRLDQLSGGMKQRAGLARALAADATVLLMDEAFSALDPLIRRDMQGELVALQRRLRKTVVFVSHDLDEAIALGGRIALMKDGIIVQEGSAESILAALATPYVARFVEHIDASSVLRVGTLAEPAKAGGDGAPALSPDGRLLGRANGTGGPTPCASLHADLTLREALPLLASEPDGIPVVDAEGRCLGVLWRKTALTALAHRTQGRAQGGAQGGAQKTDQRDDPAWTSPSPASRSTTSSTARSTGSRQTAPALPGS